MPWTFWKVLLTIVGAAILSALGIYIYTHLKWDFKGEGHSWKDKLRTIHVNELWRQFHDTELNPKVSYARHTISIHENRANFKRVKWSSPRETHQRCQRTPVVRASLVRRQPLRYRRQRIQTFGYRPRLDVPHAAAVPHDLKVDKDVLPFWPQSDRSTTGSPPALRPFPAGPGSPGTKKSRKLQGAGAIMHSGPPP
ncbi:hypothetical protein AOQ71_19510 [Bradyrhizobium manausense]|uniref:T6SS Phospholipase effector Tle1-like catalytic domain-containing protein n=1 Tax=Bradyrhizobium manausense TaxID=989370 RepID=A0A0R3DT20_9BRAD|nr:hypothetical protein AOQ71_19510 [Bradyrhizobium manausense]